MYLIATSIVVLTLLFESAGLPLAIVIGIVSGFQLESAMVNRTHALLFGFLIGLLIDLMTLNILGLTSIILTLQVTIFQIMKYRFGDINQLWFILIAIATHIIRQIVQSEPYSIYSVIVIVIVSWVSYAIFFKLDKSNTIQLRQNKFQ